MKNFLKYIGGLFLIVLILLEITLRVFGFAARTMPTKNVDGNYLFAPGDSGYWVRGGLGEIRNYYEINNQGFNSIVDYEGLDSATINIALIGDSYIQGFQTDVRKSIGRQLENLLGPKYIVHEFGRAGANIVDYGLVYNEYIKSKSYDYIFVLVTDKDLMGSKASFMDRGNSLPKQTLIRKIYDKIHILRYLNINHGLGAHFNQLISNGPGSIDRIHRRNDTKKAISEQSYLNDINQNAIRTFPKSTIFLYEEEKLSTYFIENFKFEFNRIIHKRQPIDHGFDGHWNTNGRYNCARSMADWIENP